MLLAGTVFPLWSGYESRVALVARFLRSGASYSGLLAVGLLEDSFWCFILTVLKCFSALIVSLA